MGGRRTAASAPEQPQTKHTSADLEGDAAIAAFPDAFDHRQRPKCGHWSPLGGPCICGDPANHEPDGRFGGGTFGPGRMTLTWLPAERRWTR